MIDPAQQIYDCFYDWLTGRFPGMKVIRRRANAPAPKGHHLVIDESQGMIPSGTSTHGFQDATDFQSKVQDFTGEMAIWEIGAGSGTLARILADLPLLASSEFFGSRRVAILKQGGIVPVPDPDDNQYREQFRLGLTVAVSVGQSDESLTYIETISVTNNIHK